MTKVKFFTKSFLIIFFSLFLFCFSSCSMRAEQKSLTTQLELIDSLIMQNQFADAVKDLKKLEKYAYDSWICIGLYKRYELMGESLAAEKIVRKSLKKNSNSLELNAILSKMLIKKNKIEEALDVAKILKNTSYGSIYSECVLKQSFLQKQNNDPSFYKNEELYNVYYDAYIGSKNSVWIRNCALFNIAKGLYENAFLLMPDSFVNYDDAYFWSLVCYDSKHYYECIDVLETAKKNFNSDLLKIVALESDCYMAISDMIAAEEVRKVIVQNPESVQVLDSDDEYLVPLILVNSAIWAKNQQLDNECADILFYTVNKWPLFVPALILYADFAYESNLNRVEDSEMINLRNAGIFSSEMESYDSRRKLPLSDALFRIEKALQETNNPYLSLTQLDLKYKINSNVSQKDKIRDLWYMLEDNNSIQLEYKSLLVQYAVNLLLGINDFDNAWNIFIDYVNSKSKVAVNKDNVWNYMIENLNSFELPITEIAAYFAASFGHRTEALRLFEFCVYESGGILEQNVLSPYVSTQTAMNLANFYYSTGKIENSLDLYGKAAGRESNNRLRSDIFYKIACINAEQGDKKNALRSVDYALSIYPENAKASLLKTKLQ